ncbi:hypothetical protein [Paractinoplanes lichenicola]|uniref:Lipoprotein n=1 Tax=Paractinoplanes lichenicola TaxID=2802976 RepID=A0ABS1VK25_9ACTN|nr:hypothetical protein [Actinoplanes lichenicola]MBL7255067.1 hypothetical protein [Actinoplanes lichenicola]
MTTFPVRRIAVAAATTITLLLPLAACTATADVTPKPVPAPTPAPPAAPTTQLPRQKPAADPPVPSRTTATKTGRTSQPRKTVVAGTDLFGTQYAYVTSYRGNRVTFDLVEYFEWPDAAKACREDHFTTGEGVLCHDYYIRNKNLRLRRLGADPAGRYTMIDPTTGDSVRVSMAKFLKQAKTGQHLIKLTIDGGRILGAEEMWML